MTNEIGPEEKAQADAIADMLIELVKRAPTNEDAVFRKYAIKYALHLGAQHESHQYLDALLEDAQMANRIDGLIIAARNN